ncbi:hypothetical protein BBP40_003362 [Aspergillus hancockii]|nr:hypothetical protein BBP40_003362 [Aspergillus hancockii]
MAACHSCDTDSANRSKHGREKVRSRDVVSMISDVTFCAASMHILANSQRSRSSSLGGFDVAVTAACCEFIE